MRAALAAAIALAPLLQGCVIAVANKAPVQSEAGPAKSKFAEPRPVEVAAATPPVTSQYLFGSGEAAALSEQAYNVLVDHVRIAVEARRIKPGPFTSVVLAPSATLDEPATLPCDPARPLAAVFDMDETVVLNLGYEYDEARSGAGFDAARWARFEQSGGAALSAVPGAVRAFEALRRMGVAVIVNTNRSADAAAAAEQALAGAGLGSFRHGDTLFLKGDVDGKSGKDGRRGDIAKRYCVIAMGGDQLGDFSDLFAGAPGVRRAAVQSAAVQGFFGRFWFILPNPVYGSGLAGDWDEVFPPDRRWHDPAGPIAQQPDPKQPNGQQPNIKQGVE